MTTKKMEIVETHFIMPNKKGVLKKHPITLEITEHRIVFAKSPFGMKDEIKAMAGAKWHGFEKPTPRKVWSVKNNERNRFQMEYLRGGNPYAWFDQPLKHHEYKRPLFEHQKMMADTCLTYHYQILAAEQGTGKTLTAIEVMEQSGCKHWFWVGPKMTLPAIKMEFEKWQLDPTIKVECMTYKRLAILKQSGDFKPPGGVIFDEASKLKSQGVLRQVAAQELADEIREEFGREKGYVILMSGTPSPKKPTDIWSLAEITWPGFLREGSPKALESRLAVMEKASGEFGHFMQRVGWLDADGLCKVCCLPAGEGPHAQDGMYDPDDIHKFDPAINEVALLNERLKGLMIVVRKSECLDLPKMMFKKVYLTPTKKLLRVAKAVVNTAVSTITGLIKLRCLSDGFMYRDVESGEAVCDVCKGEGECEQWFNPKDPEQTYDSIDMFNPDVVRSLSKQTRVCPKCDGEKKITTYTKEAYEIPCPKVEALEEYLDKAESDGRILVFAGFKGSVDRCVETALNSGWQVFKADGRGTSIIVRDSEGNDTRVMGVEPLKYWSDMGNERVAFVANPDSAGFGLTLIEANIAVFYSNSYKPEMRGQAMARMHRPGQEKDCLVVDLIHLPTDERVIEILDDNVKLERMVLGDVIGDSLEIETGGNE